MNDKNMSAFVQHVEEFMFQGFYIMDTSGKRYVPKQCLQKSRKSQNILHGGLLTQLLLTKGLYSYCTLCISTLAIKVRIYHAAESFLKVTGN